MSIDYNLKTANSSIERLRNRRRQEEKSRSNWRKGLKEWRKKGVVLGEIGAWCRCNNNYVKICNLLSKLNNHKTYGVILVRTNFADKCVYFLSINSLSRKCISSHVKPTNFKRYVKSPFVFLYDFICCHLPGTTRIIRKICGIRDCIKTIVLPIRPGNMQGTQCISVFLGVTFVLQLQTVVFFVA